MARAALHLLRVDQIEQQIGALAVGKVHFMLENDTGQGARRVATVTQLLRATYGEARTRLEVTIDDTDFGVPLEALRGPIEAYVANAVRIITGDVLLAPCAAISTRFIK